ncbi:MocR-like pyridoxine biosynthesis transcription factor PdxR [Priestia abyssalis]|uniref:MocR-like pyridoxine biosynthesis transcription factor PdxR n=1 Tax=Priestia abyssalis TaxID=1221450 RepID=UPI000994B042|nr:PLP-dependent aminotransferase family protein [Priestia abyssalis]
MDWRPDRGLKVPLYLQIKQHIQMKIENGEWTAGTKIPTQRQLAHMFHVNRSTIILALEELIADGLIEGKAGKGTRVINNSWSLMGSQAPPDWNKYVKSGMFVPNAPIIQDINQTEFVPEIIRLGTGELALDLFPKEKMKAILNRLAMNVESMGYEEPKGSLFLRKQLADHLHSKGIETSSSSILITSGSLQALQLISIGILHPGSIVLHEAPSYLRSLQLFQSAGMRLKGVPLDGDGIEVKTLKERHSINKSTILYTIPTFHNPTGTTMPEKRRLELMEFAEKKQLPIIEDDAYGELWFDSPPPKPLKGMDKGGLVLYLGSFSKSLSPGLRIGWVVGPESVINRLADIKMQIDYGSSSLSQMAAAEWLASGLYDEYLHFIRSELRKRRRLALQVLDAYMSKIAEWTIPSGGFYIWIRILPEISMQKLFECAKKAGVLINPGSLYDPSANQFIRLSYSYAKEGELEEGIVRLSKLINTLQKG